MDQSYQLGFNILENQLPFGIFDKNMNLMNLRTIETLVHVFWNAKKYEFNKLENMRDLQLNTFLKYWLNTSKYYRNTYQYCQITCEYWTGEYTPSARVILVSW